jgi:hypothetical protein
MGRDVRNAQRNEQEWLAGNGPQRCVPMTQGRPWIRFNGWPCLGRPRSKRECRASYGIEAKEIREAQGDPPGKWFPTENASRQ